MPFNLRILLQKKMVEEVESSLLPQQHLNRSLSRLDLVLLGIGAVIGAGIFILTGWVAATEAGPAVVFSFVLASIACLFSALSYAELAAAIGGCGSAYGYAYAGFGEIFAWIIGWDLILEYGLSVSTVAIGWSSYCTDLLKSMGILLSPHWLNGPFQSGWVNIPAMGIVLFLMGLLMVGVKASARFNAIIVFIKLAAIFLFVGVAFFHIHWENWKPFMPFGWTGVMHGAALIFFAYIGFDAVSTAAEEVKNPQRDMPQGILYSLLICTGIYILVAALLTLIAPYSHLNTPSPVSDVLLHLGYRLVASAVAVGALAGLTTVIFVMFYGLSRISFAMSRDTLLPSFFSFVNSVTKTPIRTLFFSGITMALLAGLLPLRVAAELVNIGTLAAFLCVNLGVVVLRRTRPSLPRPFKVPLGLVCPSLGIFFCLYLIVSLPSIAILRFVIWMLVGFLFYGYRLTQRTP